MKRTIVGLSLLAVASFAAAAGVITGVEVRNVGGGVEVQVTGTDLKTPKTERAWQGQAFICAFDAKLLINGKRQTINSSGVEYVQWTQFTVRPLVTRVVLRMRPTDSPKIQSTSGGYTIRVNVAESKPAEEARPVLPPVNHGLIPDSSSRSNVESVGDGSSSGLVNPLTPAPTTIPKVTASSRTGSGSNPTAILSGSAQREKLVSLNFEKTDIVLILKAITSQSGTNIVTSPDVKGEISVQFDNVTVDHALQIITAISGLRYQKVKNTIIVAPSEKIGQIVANIQAGESTDTTLQTRIIPIYSHQGKQIRSVVYRVLPQDAKGGRYDLVLPTEQNVPNPADAAPPAKEGDPGKAPADSGSKPAADGGGDEYVMVIGSPARLAEVEAVVKALDNQICGAIGVEVPTSSAMVQETYPVLGSSAGILLATLGVKDGKLGNVAVSATPATSSSRQQIVLNGRANEVNRILNMLKELDAPPSEDETFFVYDVKNADPRALRDTLMLQVPGVFCMVPPAGAGGVRLYKPISFSTSATTDGKSSSESSSTSQEGDSGKTEGPAKSDGLKSGLQQPFNSMETSAVPMRLVLRGKSDTLGRARQLLDMLDVNPKQLAIELRVMELTKEDALKAGFDWNLFTGGAVKFIRFNNSLSGQSNSMGVNINDRNFAGDVVGALDGIITNTNLIARPNMVGYDGRESEIFIGDVIRYVESITSGQNGPSVQIGEVRVGVNLAVLPRITADGTATLDIRPTVSSLKGFNKVSVQGFAADLPQTTETVSQSTVQVSDGQTIAIGGLITQEMVQKSTGIPILKDLPILGNLFKSTDNQMKRRELVIFLTTRRIDGPLGSDDKLPLENDLTKPKPKTNKPK